MDSQQTSLSTEKSPAVRVFQDGKEVPAAGAIPNVLSWVYQAVMAAHIARLRKLEESKVPTGTLSFTRTISDNPFDIDPDELDLPWISFSVINAGPGGLHVEVTTSEAMLNRSAFVPAGGTKNIDFGFPAITMVMFAAAPGTTATITVAAVKGKG